MLIRISLFICVATIFFGQPILAQNPRNIDLFVPAQDAVQRDIPRTVVKRRSATINPQALKQAQKRGATLQFNLFPETTFTGIVDSIEWRSENDYSLSGQL